jgi:hypothetical protein
LKELYESEPALGALVPAGAVAASGGIGTRLWEAVVTGLGDRLSRLHVVVEALTSTKAAAVVASTAAVAAGAGAVVRAPVERPAPRAPTRVLARTAAPAPMKVSPATVRRSVQPARVARTHQARVPRTPKSAKAPTRQRSVVRRRAPQSEFGFELVRAVRARNAGTDRKIGVTRPGARAVSGATPVREFAFED